MSLHRIDQSKDKHFWSVRAGSDIRIIKVDANNMTGAPKKEIHNSSKLHSKYILTFIH